MATKTFVTFKMNDELFGIDILSIREINRQMDATYVPQAPSFIHGLINLRGQIVTLMDLKRRLGLGNIEVTPETHTIILNNEDAATSGRSEADRVGVLVDEICDIIAVEESQLESPPANIGELDGSYLNQVVKMDDLVVAVLNVDKVLELTSVN